MKKYILILAINAFCFGGDFDCSKKYCKQMVSCEEAKYYLNVCGVSKFDKDGDGVPCENICRKGKRK